MNAQTQNLVPNKALISAHLYALFDPAFVKTYPDAWIEIAFGRPNGQPDAAENFSVFDLQTAVEFAERKSGAGFNVYVGPALRQGPRPDGGRSNDNDVATSALAWAEYDGAGDDERIGAILKANNLTPALVVTTGTIPHVRRHLYFKFDGTVTPQQLKAVNTALMKLLDSDAVQNTGRIMRLAGTVNYPTPAKQARGYVAELVTLRQNPDARAFSAEELIALRPASADAQPNGHDFNHAASLRRTDDDLFTLLEKSRQAGQWHDSMRDAIATMIGRGWSDGAIRFTCASYCEDGKDDPHLDPLINGARRKWNKPNEEQAGGTAIPTIQIVNGELSSLATRGEEILISAGVQIYQRGGTLVRPIIETVDATRGRRTKVAQLKILDPVYMRDRLGRHANWERYNERKNKTVRTNPPMEIAATIIARVGDWTFPAISGVISTPTMRPDGSLLTEQGYDESTELLLVEPPTMPPIPERPTRDDALQALSLLESLLTGFPFVDDVAKACALSAIITPIVRGAFPVTPLHASRAPTAGSGKSFLWDIVAAIAIGQPMPVMSTGANTEETEKRLGAALLAGQPLISIDNISGELGGDALCQIIERPVVEIRVLGRSERVRIEARGTSLYATGNNFVVLGDVCRRVIIANLDPALERPELRQFAFDPVELVLEDRGKYIAAILTICRAYVVAGKPNLRPRLASFEGWSDTVRSALTWLGRADPVDSMETARAEDPERIELIEMMQAWERVLGWGFSNRWKLSNVITRGTAMVREDQTSPLEPEHPDLYAALEALAARTTGKRGQKPDARMLGTWLRQFKGRIVDGKRFMNQPNDKSGSEWWVERVNKSANADATEEGGIGGYEGVSSGPTPASSHNQGSALF